MIPPWELRIAKIREKHHFDSSIEGHILYQGRIKTIAEEELLAVVRSPYGSVQNKLEAVLQILEHCRVKSYHG